MCELRSLRLSAVSDLGARAGTSLYVCLALGNETESLTTQIAASAPVHTSFHLFIGALAGTHVKGSGARGGRVGERGREGTRRP